MSKKDGVECKETTWCDGDDEEEEGRGGMVAIQKKYKGNKRKKLKENASQMTRKKVSVPQAHTSRQPNKQNPYTNRAIFCTCNMQPPKSPSHVTQIESLDL